MNRSVVMIMGGALIVAIFVAMIVQSKLSGGGSSKSAPSVEILVAKKNLAIGQQIKPDDVGWQKWSEASLYKGVIKRSEQEDEKKLIVYDTPLRRNVEAGEPITMQAVIADIKGGNSYLAAAIAPGMRAMAISVKAESSVAGFLSPGDYVDVILSFTPTINSEMKDYSEQIVQRYASQTVLSNVKVLAVDQEAKDEDREAKIAKTVTLELSKEGTEVLALAANMGDLSLALRRLGDKDDTQVSKPSLTTDSTTIDVLKKVKEVMIKQKTNSDTVRVYSGTTIQNVPVRAPADQ